MTGRDKPAARFNIHAEHPLARCNIWEQRNTSTYLWGTTQRFGSAAPQVFSTPHLGIG
jgi:hypothetical protein